MILPQEDYSEKFDELRKIVLQYQVINTVRRK